MYHKEKRFNFFILDLTDRQTVCTEIKSPCGLTNKIDFFITKYHNHVFLLEWSKTMIVNMVDMNQVACLYATCMNLCGLKNVRGKNVPHSCSETSM